MRLGKLGGGGGLQGARVPLVNPDDPLRARATLLLGSGCGARSSRFRRLHERQTGTRSDYFALSGFSPPPPVHSADEVDPVVLGSS